MKKKTERNQQLDEAGDKTISGRESLFNEKRVLVVDDIPINRIVLVKILKKLGAECHIAENGQEAVEKFEASKPGEYDIIFMDIEMPILNGYEAVKTIRASSHPSAQTLSIIAMISNALEDDIRAALDAGMNAYVTKPVVSDQLEEAVVEVLERKVL